MGCGCQNRLATRAAAAGGVSRELSFLFILYLHKKEAIHLAFSLHHRSVSGNRRGLKIRLQTECESSALTLKNPPN
jgi:hypothetical protein